MSQIDPDAPKPFVLSMLHPVVSVDSWDKDAWVASLGLAVAPLMVVAAPAVFDNDKSYPHFWVGVITSSRNNHDGFYGAACRSSVELRNSTAGAYKRAIATSYQGPLSYYRLEKIVGRLNRFDEDFFLSELGLTLPPMAVPPGPRMNVFNEMFRRHIVYTLKR